MPDLRVAIAGAGAVAAVHARATVHAGATLVGIAASTPERTRAAAERLGIPAPFATAEQLVEADEVDVVHVCTPNHLHFPLAERAFAAGKHVVCEKPLANDLAGAQALAQVARAAGTVGAVPFVYRYCAAARELRERVRRGEVGELALVHGTYLQSWMLHADAGVWRADAARGGASRAFADVGSHWCDLAELLSEQRIARVCARTLAGAPGALHRDGADDVVTVQFETDAGALGSLVVSQVSPGRRNRLWIELSGNAGGLAFDQESDSLWHGAPDGSSSEHRSEGATHGHFDRFVADVYAAIADGVAPADMPTIEDGLRAAVIADAVLRSARERAWVEVGER
jgi:predicted dehydrogenase